MTLIMAWVLLVSSAIAAVAILADHFARRGPFGRRWIWLCALGSLAAVTGWALFVPIRDEAPIAENAATPLAAAERGATAAAGFVPVASTGRLQVANSIATGAWIVASAALLLAVGWGQWKVIRATRRARRIRMHGQPVLLTEDLGPAVAGVRSPQVLVPRWAMALDDVSQRLLLAHELEHARRGDTVMLLLAALFAALLPWNPVAWWLGRKLRVAVELDCDRRVLAAHPELRAYADLLLVASSKPRFPTHVLAAHLGEHSSDLEQRIDAMTNTRWQWRATLAPAVGAAMLVLVSCEAPRPDPVAPVGVRTSPSEAFTEVALTRAASLAVGSRMPRYPEILRQAGVEGQVLASFVITAAGTADAATFKAVESTHELFTVAVKQVLPEMRFVPAEADGKAVPQRVEQPFTFALVGGEGSTRPLARERRGTQPEVVVSGVQGRQPAFIVRRRGIDSVRPTVVVRSSAGRELMRLEGEIRVDDLPADAIQSVEVVKGAACRGCEGGLVMITLKPGATLPNASYRRRIP